MTVRKRSEQRQALRDAKKLSDARVKLFALSDGGSPEHPRVAESASLVEPRALATPCPACEGALVLRSHDAKVVGARTLRAARMQCRQCGQPWTVWFAIERPLAQ
ncbi:MAG: hypothetical protein Q8Q09_14755 [Deltaproteobacteria bacterium]|nr:hypothetical protein [Deltaproteobacteria bacterium]